MAVHSNWRDSVKNFSLEISHIDNAYYVATKALDGKKYAKEGLRWLDFTDDQRERIATLFEKGTSPLEIFTIKEESPEGSGIFFEGNEVITLSKKAGITTYNRETKEWNYGEKFNSVSEYRAKISGVLERRERSAILEKVFQQQISEPVVRGSFDTCDISDEWSDDSW